MKIGVEYLRYSSERQTEQSIEGQMRVCDEYAKKNDIVIVERYIDRAMTGKNDNREAFQKMLSDSAKKAWDYVLVYKIDRFGRNKYEIAINKHTLRNNGVKVMSVMENIPDTPEGIILESLLEGMAEYYSAELSQKVTRGMRESRLKGQYTGGYIPYGYRVENKKVYINESEAEIVRFIFSQYANDVFVKDIIKDLTNKGIYRRGKKFAKTTIYSILENEKYTGTYRHGDDVFYNIYPRIIPEEIYSIVAKKKEINHFGKHDSPARYILKNKIECGHCGSSIISESGTARDGTVKRYYKCNGRKEKHSCKKSIIRKELLEEIVINITIKVLNDSNLLSELAERILSDKRRIIENQTIENILKQEIQDTELAIENILSAIERGILTSSTKTRLEELENKLCDLNEKLLIESSKQNISITKEEIVKYIKSAIKQEPKAMINMLIKKIILYDDKIDIYYNYIDNRRPECDEHRAFSFYSEIYKSFYFNKKFQYYKETAGVYKVNYKYIVELFI